MMTRMHLPLIAGLIFTTIGAELSRGTSVRQHNLEQLTGMASQVFVGDVISVSQEFEPRINGPVWVTRFEVVRPIKGVQSSQVVLRQIASRVPGQFSPIPGTPSFASKGQFLVFLHGESALGLSSVVGVYQGRMPIIDLPDGRKAVVGSFRENMLLNGLSDPAVKSSLLKSTTSLTNRTGQSTRLADYTTLMGILDGMAGAH